jgi:hypothetical protein
MRKFLFHIAFLLAMFSVSAQKDTSRPNLSDDKYEPKFNKALMYDPGRSIDYNSRGGPGISKAVKFDPTLLLRKTVAIGFEKQFTDIALECTVGYSFGMDNLLKWGLGTLTGDYTYFTGKVDLPTLIKGASSNEYGGLYLSASGRYFWGEHFDGYYLGVAARQSKFGFDVDPYTLGSITGSNWQAGAATRVNVTNTAVHILQGYQTNNGGRKCIVSEFYFGTGLRLSRFTEISLNEGPNFGSPSNNTLIPGTGTNTKLGLSFIAGYIIGFGF